MGVQAKERVVGVLQDSREKRRQRLGGGRRSEQKKGQSHDEDGSCHDPPR